MAALTVSGVCLHGVMELACAAALTVSGVCLHGVMELACVATLTVSGVCLHGVMELACAAALTVSGVCFGYRMFSSKVFLASLLALSRSFLFLRLSSSSSWSLQHFLLFLIQLARFLRPQECILNVTEAVTDGGKLTIKWEVKSQERTMYVCLY